MRVGVGFLFSLTVCGGSATCGVPPLGICGQRSGLPHVKNISGIGLMVGIEFFDVQAADVLAACREKGLLVLTAKTRLRLLPPLTVSEHEVDMALEVLAEVLGSMEPTAPKEQA